MSNSEVRSFSVSQYNTAIQRRLAEVPNVWVQGVITQLRVRDPMVYLTLAEFKSGEERPVATLELSCWSKEWRNFESRFEQLSRPVKIEVDLKVSLLVKADYYVPWGKFQPRILEINADFTLGELALTREKILQNLRKDGLLDLNRQRPMPQPALRIGLITAPNSAAYHDFCQTLDYSPFAFYIIPFFAKMQGDQCAQTIVKMIEQIDFETIDVLCIIRGGGAKTDLVYFDNEELCRKIATAPVPVLTGIGHQIDTSIADMVAWENRITPTDCARFLIEIAAISWNRLIRLSQELREISLSKIHRARNKPELLSQRVRQEWHYRSSKLHQQLSFTGQRLRFATEKRCHTTLNQIQHYQTQLQLLDPRTLFAKGWTITIDPETRQRISLQKLREGQEIETLGHGGRIKSKIEKITLQ